MTYDELYKIAYKYIDNNSNFPNAFDIAQRLNIRIKNSIEARRDLINGKNPLEYCNGCLTVTNGEYTIYYNEKSPYCNFTVAHEIAHYLLHHYSDGSDQHHDANILAAILVAPKKSVQNNKIKNEIELSEKYKIPVEVAQIYWEFLDLKSRKDFIKWFVIAVAILLVTFSIISLYNKPHTTNMNDNVIPTNTPTITTYIKSSTHDPVFVTTSGDKYHKHNCYYIENKDNLIELTVETAENAGYKPCKICF